jgi:hypothetical protein
VCLFFVCLFFVCVKKRERIFFSVRFIWLECSVRVFVLAILFSVHSPLLSALCRKNES